MWDIEPPVGPLTAILPLVVAVTLAGFVPPRYEPRTALLAKQRWHYRDFILALGVLTGVHFVSLPGLSTVTGMWRWAIESGFMTVAFTVGVWSVVRWRQRRPWRALGFEPTTAIDNILWALRISLGVVSAFTVCVVLARLAVDPGTATSPIGRAVWHGQVGGFVAAVVVTAVLGPLAEELFFRGLAYGPLFRRFGAVGATLASAIIWAVAHYSGLSFTGVLRMSFVLGLGIVYAEVYRRRESLVPTVVFHIVGNITAFFIRDHHLVVLLPLAGASVVLWIASALLLRVVRRL